MYDDVLYQSIETFNFNIDKEDEHQPDAYWVFGLHCQLCRKNHTILDGK